MSCFTRLGDEIVDSVTCMSDRKLNFVVLERYWNYELKICSETNLQDAQKQMHLDIGLSVQ